MTAQQESRLWPVLAVVLLVTIGVLFGTVMRGVA